VTVRAPVRPAAVALTLVLLTLGGTASAQVQEAPDLVSFEEWKASFRRLGLGVSASSPYADFGDAYNTGFGVHALLEQPLIPLINVTASAGWRRFAAEGEADDVNVFNVGVGGRLLFGWFFMGFETGYYSEIDKVGWEPLFGLRLDRFEIALQYTSAGRDAWATLRAGYFF
jgi:hypothetical protein